MYDDLNLKEKVQVHIKNKKRISLKQSLITMTVLIILLVSYSFLKKII